MRGRGNTNRNKLASGPRLEDHRPRRPNWRNDGSDPANGTPDSVEQTFAWGPDLSSTEQGAGGIGGLAAMLDDSFELGGGSGAVGHMFPVYDGNGNIVKVYSTEIQQDLMTSVAEYRYGPFGEQRGQSGSMATRLPFRWSTKFTDNETALVYYGYRYYSGSLGRWVSRNPIAEQGGFGLYSFVRNNPNNKIDLFGLDDFELGWHQTEVISDTYGEFGSRRQPQGAQYYRWHEFHNFMRSGSWYSYAGFKFNGSKWLSHYLSASGTDLILDSKSFYNENKNSVQQDYNRELLAMANYVRTLPPGTHRIRSRRASLGQIDRNESPDWFRAVSGYQYFSHGVVTVSCDRFDGWNYDLDFHFQVYDRFNFNRTGATSTSFALPSVLKSAIPELLSSSIDGDTLHLPDSLIGELHLLGWAREFDTHGTLSETYNFGGVVDPMPSNPKDDRYWMLKPIVRYQSGQLAPVPPKPAVRP